MVDTGLFLKTTSYADDGNDQVVVDVLHDMSTPNGIYDPDLRAAVAAAILRFPNTDAPHWIGPEAVLGAVERFLIAQGGQR